MLDKEYKIQVLEYHTVDKTYYINAINKQEAIKRAKAHDWDDATESIATGNIVKVKILSTKEEK